MLNWGKKRIIGLDIDEGSCIATELLACGKNISLTKFTVASDLKELIKAGSFKGKDVIINLPSQVVLFRSFHLVTSLLSSKNKQKDIVAFLSRQNLPFKLEECFWGNFTLNGNFNLIAARKEVVERNISQVVSGSGFAVSGVTASLVALYNVLIYTYPERINDRFALLNIRMNSSELLIYETKHLWVYPISIGKADLVDSSDSLERFAIEVHSIFNAHYLQNPRVIQNVPNYFYLSGQDSSKGLVSSFKNVLSDFEVISFDPFKKINLTSKDPLINRQLLNLSIGLGLTYLRAPYCLKINIIERKIRKELFLAWLALAKKASLLLMALVSAMLLLWDVALFRELKNQITIDKDIQFQTSSVLPSLKAVKEEKEKLQGLKDFLENKLNQQRLYLKGLAAISETRPGSVAIKEFNAQMRDPGLEVFLSGIAPSYQEINDFLTRLKKNGDLKEVKVIASTFSSPEAQSKEIDFKLRFDVTDVNIKAQPVKALEPRREPKGKAVKGGKK